jgi:ABC-2 type transport system ATP-binding protein
VLAEIRALEGVTSVAALDGIGIRIEVDAEGVTQRVLERLVAAGVGSVRTSLPSLEEVYVHLIGERGMEI